MTAVEKRKIIEAIDTCVRGDLFTDSEVDRIKTDRNEKGFGSTGR